MTNLEALRILPAEQLADFLAEQRMVGVRTLLEEYRQGERADALKSNILDMFLAWLSKECEV